jgi:RNA polymerase sigma factor (TIGR02999 family)
LVGRPANGWVDRRHFFSVAATAMRQILVNHARDRAAEKRGGSGPRRVLLESGVQDIAPAKAGGSNPVDVISLHEALENLGQIDERKHRVVELRFFGGLNVEEIADVLGVSKTTVESDWRAARAWLATHLRDDFATSSV